MREYMKKCTGDLDIAVVPLSDLGDDRMRTRPIMPAMATDSKEEESISGTPEKRSRDARHAELDSHNSSFIELRSTRRKVSMEVSTAGSRSNGALTSAEKRNSSFEPASCSSSKASVDANGDRSIIPHPTTQGRTESAQFETLTFSGGIEEREKAIPLTEDSGNLESMASVDPNSSHKSTVTDIPLELEIEEFFSAAEKDLHKRFSQRYNFDIVKGIPLEGRYEWVREKP